MTKVNQTDTGTVAHGAPAKGGGGHPHTRSSTIAKFIGVVHVTGKQITDWTSPIIDPLKKVITDMTGAVPATLFGKKVVIRALKPGIDIFINDMATLEEDFGPQLGHLTTVPADMRETTRVAAACDAFIAPLSTALVVFTNIRNYSLGVGYRDAMINYRRALSVSETNPEIAKAIAKYRDAFSRVGKKGAATRKKKEAAPPPEPPPPPPETPKIVTTTFPI